MGRTARWSLRGKGILPGHSYDERGQRIAKLSGGEFVAGYLDEGYLDSTGLSEPVRFAGRPIGILKSGVFEAIATDAKGTLFAESDGQARIASPFGERDVHPALAAVIDYVSKGYDADLGLIRMGVRDYDPQINRFTTPDPLFLEAPEKCLGRSVGCNLYSYANGDPVGMVDPNGLAPMDGPTNARFFRRSVKRTAKEASSSIFSNLPGPFRISASSPVEAFAKDNPRGSPFFGRPGAFSLAAAAERELSWKWTPKLPGLILEVRGRT